MNIWGEEDENTTFNCFSKFRNIRNYIGKFVSNQCVRVKNWKFNPILMGLHEFQEKNQETRKS